MIGSIIFEVIATVLTGFLDAPKTGEYMLELFGVKDPKQHETWCLIVGIGTWITLIVGPIIFVLWLFSSGNDGK